MSHRNKGVPPAAHPHPLVVTLNCVEDTILEQECLSGVAQVQHVPLSRLADSRIESAAAVLLHSLAFLPRAAQRRLRPWQLILCLGSSDRDVDSALAAELGLDRLLHVDVSRAEEVADTVMALILGLLRRTHLLSRHALSANGWLGSVQPLCRGMRRCRGLVLGIVGRSASAMALACRSLAFKMNVLYFDVQQGSRRLNRLAFPEAARKMDTLNDLLAASDLISLHCALTTETVQIISADCLKHVKPGAFLVNTGSSQLLDDCAVKELLIDGTLAGCALDGAEGPQWMEAWVREMPNVVILPRSADYSEEVWMEIREKAISILQQFFVDERIPTNAVSDEDEKESDVECTNDLSQTLDNEVSFPGSVIDRVTEDIQLLDKPKNDAHSDLIEDASSRSETKRSRSSKKSKKRHGRQKFHYKVNDASTYKKADTSIREEDASMSGTDEVLSSGSQSTSPENTRTQKTPVESKADVHPESNVELGKTSRELLKDGYIIALHAKDHPALHISRQRVQGGGWFLETSLNVTKRDPASQFLVVFCSKDTIGLRSFTAGGKLLQINRKMEFVFTSHSFDVWESWRVEGSLEDCRLVNCRNPEATLDVRAEIIAAAGEDGIARWLG